MEGGGGEVGSHGRATMASLQYRVAMYMCMSNVKAILEESKRK